MNHLQRTGSGMKAGIPRQSQLFGNKQRYVNRMSYSAIEGKAILTTAGNHLRHFKETKFGILRCQNVCKQWQKKKKQLHYIAFLKFFQNLHSRDAFRRKY